MKIYSYKEGSTTFLSNGKYRIRCEDEFTAEYYDEFGELDLERVLKEMPEIQEILDDCVSFQVEIVE